MASAVTLKQYIDAADKIIEAGDKEAAKSKVTQILSTFESEYEGLRSQLDRYSYSRLRANSRYLSVDEANDLGDLTLLRDRLQAELDKIMPHEDLSERNKIFMSHRSEDKEVADLLYEFLVAAGIPGDRFFYSSLPGNNVKEKIGTEIRQNLRDSAIVILILSRKFYESAYCLNEAGIAWYLDGVTVIPIAMPEINPDKMVGFLNSEYKLRRLDIDDDIAYIYDEIIHVLGLQASSITIVHREIIKCKQKYCDYLKTRKDMVYEQYTGPRFEGIEQEVWELSPMEQAALEYIRVHRGYTTGMGDALGISIETYRLLIQMLLLKEKIYVYDDDTPKMPTQYAIIGE